MTNLNKASLSDVLNKDENSYHDLGLQHHLSLYRLYDGAMHLVLEVNHAIVDGHSTFMMMEELAYFYNGGENLPPAQTYREIVSFIDKKPIDEGLGYWTCFLANVEPCYFPELDLDQTEQASKEWIDFISVPDINTNGIRMFCAERELTPATLIQVAWAMVLKAYTGIQRPSFGVICSGRDHPIEGINSIFGPTLSIITASISLSSKDSVISALSATQSDYLTALQHQMVPLAAVHSALGLGSSALFNTVLSVQKIESDVVGGIKHGLSMQFVNEVDPSDYPLSVRVLDTRTEIKILIDHSGKLGSFQKTQLGRCFSTAIRSITSNAQASISDLSLLDDHSLEKAWAWNQEVPSPIEACVNHLIEKQTLSTPHSFAIDSWDGKMSYSDLDCYSHVLACYLVSLGVGPGSRVPVCFDKTLWVVVAMLGILKAGAAFVPLDFTQASERREMVLTQVNASIILTSQELKTMLSNSSDCHPVALNASLMQNLESEYQGKKLTTVQANPSSIMYYLFTSGSTGIPKGVALQHRAVSTSCTYHGHRIGFSKSTRTLQFSSYTFDACIFEIFTTLIFGGCICIPSPTQRLDDIAGSIQKMKVNTALLTPTVARLVDPSGVSSLRTIVLGGEAAYSADFARWDNLDVIMNAYGPTECAITCVMNDQGSNAAHKISIGTPVGTTCWVVDPQVETKLAPIGAIGELVVEGAQLAHGYLDDEVRTNESFIENPSWLISGSSMIPGRQGRVYKTGDLVRYISDDGHLAYVGRKDAQVKLHGQRMELAETESQMMACIPEAIQVSALIAKPGGESVGMALVGFIVLQDPNVSTVSALQPDTNSSPEKANARVHQLSPSTEEKLAKRLPNYMIPTIWFAIGQLPMTSSDKTDRKALERIVSSFTVNELAAAKRVRSSRAVSTEKERRMQQLWATVLGLDGSSISPDDSFFRLGGDSITAMELVSQARKNGMTLSVAQIFQQPELGHLSAQLSINSDTTDAPTGTRVFSLLGEDVDITDCRDKVGQLCGVDALNIQDIYPCTPLQAGLMSLTSKQSGSYILQRVMNIHASIDLQRFKDAWEMSVQYCSILRTRIVQCDGIGLVQVVLRDTRIDWQHPNNLELFLEQEKHASMGLGELLTRFSLFEDNSSTMFGWSIHHALYDGTSMPLILSLVKQFYHGSSPRQAPEFSLLVQYILEQNEENNRAFWKATFDQAEVQQFPPLPSSTHAVTADSTHQKSCSFVSSLGDLNTTMSTIVRAAWALTVHRFTGAEDVIFGTTLSGRNAPVTGIDRIVGPTIATVPILARITSVSTVSEFLGQLRDHATAMIPYEQIGLQNIAKISDNTHAACDFQTLLAVQPPTTSSLETEFGTWLDMPQTREFTTYAITLVCQLLADGGLDIHCRFDSNIISERRLKRIIEYFAEIIEMLTKARPDQPIDQFLGLDAMDLQQIWTWNSHVPDSINACANALVSTRARQQPDAQAVSAHDGSFTFGELDSLATRLACHLVSFGVVPGSLVPLYFEKSGWTIVAMLAILKAGGAFVPMDPNQPRDRRATILKQVNAKIVLTSEILSQTNFGSDIQVIPVGPGSFTTLTEQQLELPAGDPDSAAYVIFTSGSTGLPKGVRINHKAISSGCQYHGSKVDLGSQSRVLQFASYTFDASIFEILTTLIFGGCVCVPKEARRTDGLAEFMESMAVNTALLTPSVARYIKPSQVPSLQTLLLGGEASTAEDYSRWLPKTRVFNLYGPTEASIICNAAEVTPGVVQPRNIGTAIGSASWIVDQQNPERLMPIGAIGELLVEGPILAQGYVDDIDKTNAAFIETPTWLEKGTGQTPGRQGRLYRTGDLVRYADNGSIIYVGRRDAQVKIRGMRVELSEIEHHALACVPAQDLVVEVIKPTGQGGQGATDIIALFVVVDESNPDFLAGGAAMESHGSAYRVQPLPPIIERLMGEKLPAYMVPTLLFVLDHVDLNMAGKIDRKKLVQLGSSLSTTQLSSLQNSGVAKKRGPTTEEEAILQQIWAHTLNIEASSIGVDDSFLHLGGDSISSMQVSSSARAQGLDITTMDILRHKSIRVILQFLTSQSDHVKYGSSQLDDLVQGAQDAVNRGEVFPLGPIQQLFFLHQRDPTVLFDQCMLLEPRRRIQLSDLREALRTLVTTHSVLRTKFEVTPSGTWQQRVSPASIDGADSEFSLRHAELDSYDHISTLISNRRRDLSISNGPLVAATLIDVAQSQYLFLSIHHLVVDLVSWRVILEDVETMLSGEGKLLASSLPFETWTFLQADYARNQHQVDQALPFDLEPPMHTYWVSDAYATALPAKTTIKSFTLDERQSAALLGSSNDVLGTQPSDLMISALLFAFGQVFSDRPLPTIFNESHGREVWDSSIDLSRTVGWFTTLYPVQVRPTQTDLVDFVRHVKDCIRAVPRSGFPFFTSKFSSQEAANEFASSLPVEIMFNYGGRYQQLERRDAFFRNVPVPEDSSSQAAGYTRYALFDVLVNVTDASLGVVFIYDDSIAAGHEAKIQSWIDGYRAALNQLSLRLSVEPRQWTLTDMPNVFDSYDSIIEFQEEIMPKLGIRDLDDIEDIFPCAPTQEGILISQAKETTSYRSRISIKVLARAGCAIDVSRLREAWGAIVQRHSLLRAILVDSFPGSGRVMHVILKQIPTDAVLREVSTSDAVASVLLHGTDPQEWLLQHHLTLYRFNDREVRLVLEMNHAIVDGYSIGILLKDLSEAYGSTASLAMAPSYVNFVNHLDKHSYDESIKFWTSVLVHAEPTQFPLLGDEIETGNKQLRRESIQIQVPSINSPEIRAFCIQHEVTPATIIQTAWAMVLRHYTGSNTPSFGVLSSGRDLPINGVENIFGPLIGMLVCHVDLSNKSQGVVDLTQSVQEAYLASLPHQNVPLAAIHNALGLDVDVALFDTVISFQKPNAASAEISATDVDFTIEDGVDPSEYAISIRVVDDGAELLVLLDYRIALTSTQADQLSHCFSSAIASIVKPDNTASQLIKDVDLLDDLTWNQLWQWNHHLPPRVEKCVHEMIAEQVKIQPTRPAVFSWDGEMTYAELDVVSTRLARHLVSLGVKSGQTMIPICFDKSIWATVSILAVLKAGAAFVPIDLTQAIERREKLLDEVDGRLILTSTRYSETSFGKGTTVVAVNQELIDNLAETVPEGQELENFDRQAPCYVLFTSGSTGLPKGVLTHHEAATTSCYYSGIKMGFSSTSRVFQFGAYTFDSSITENFTTLIWGGCICIPSDDDRMDDIPKAINTLQANLTFLTPTVANLIDPKEIPSLQTIILGGEATTVQDFCRWRHLRRVLNGYGPTECTVYCVMNCDEEIYRLPARIGHSVSSVGWVADRDDPERLLPIGAVGELLVEGHILALGYLNDAERTTRTFIESPRWMQRTGRTGRLYRTGDLVRYSKNGGLVYVERADTQVKVRGQRVELKEVEVQLSTTLLHMQQTIAEVIVPSGNKSNAMVAAFVVAPESADERQERHSDEAIRVFNISPDVEKELSCRLPSYAIPTVWFEVLKLPLTVSGKTNRRKLRELGSSYSKSQLIRLQNRTKTHKRIPQTESGWKILQLYADVLNLSSSDIGVDDSFFRLGGDSVAAMKLASNARKNGLRVSVAQIFQNPKLEDLAALLGPSLKSWSTPVSTSSEKMAPFALLDIGVDIQQCRQQVAELCGVLPDAVEDIYPCTPLQEGLVAQTIKNSGDYVLQRVMELSYATDVRQFRWAWEKVVLANPILRTRIVQSEACGLQQVVLREGIEWREESSLEGYLSSDKLEAMDLGGPLARYAIVSDEASLKTFFIWTIQHSIYDGGSMPLMMKQVETAYHSGASFQQSLPEFNLFVKHMLEMNKNEASTDFWKARLSGYDSQPFPSLPSVGHTVIADKMIERACSSLPRNHQGDMTLAIVIQASLALTIHRQTGIDDVVFGMTLSGRDVGVDRIEEIVGPTITTIPVRVRVPLEVTSSVSDLISHVHHGTISAMPYEQTGLHRISAISKECQQACNFQTLLVVQPPQSESESQSTSELGAWQNISQAREFTTYAITIICQLKQDGGFNVSCAFDPNVVECWRMQRILDHFITILEEILNSPPQKPLADIAGLMPSDTEEIWRLNDEVPLAVDRCIHDIVYDQGLQRPEAVAVDGWDGKLSYQELMTTSRLIANHLRGLGIGRGVIVPLSFDKSTWTIVAMLAVLQASAAFAPLDQTQAPDRREAILQQTGANIILTSERQHDFSFGEGRSVLPIGPKLLATLQQTHKTTSEDIVQEADAESLAYVIFTSGTTGVPKGVLAHHRAVSSSCKYQGTTLGLNNETRFLQFCAYTFDASIMEILATLVFGGCICVPSQDDILGNLAGSIQKFAPNTSVMTPSVIRTLRPADISSINTLIFGGEPAFPSDFEPWIGSVDNIFNVYGPTECTVICCASRIEMLSPAEKLVSGDLGMPLGSNAWIVDPDNMDRLMPFGAVGELIIEGPIVTQGYLHDPDRTQASFIRDPSWLTPRRRGTVYKTGDLVRYSHGGRILIIGRKDKQTKLRGQRLELTEVEYHLHACIPHVEQLAVEVIPATDTSSPALAAFIVNVNDSGDAAADNDFGIHVVSTTSDIEDELSRRMPSYMVPTLWFNMTRLPLTTSGKSDRRRLRELAISYRMSTIGQPSSIVQGDKTMPVTTEERLIQSVWARVLNTHPDMIGVNDSFLRLGGDSITAMQVSSLLRASSFYVTVSHILKHKTIRRILDASEAHCAKSQTNTAALQAVVPGVPFDLSPIQKVFFGFQQNPNVEFDQCFLLKLSSTISYQQLSDALDVIVETHPMLRARFQRGLDGRWQQLIEKETVGSYLLRLEECPDDDALSSAISRCRNALDITAGPLLAGALISKAEEQNLFLTVHHLVVDLVSWRVVLQDIETLLSTNRPNAPASLPPPPLSFPAWCDLQRTHVNENLSHIKTSIDDIAPPMLSYWGVTASDDMLQDTTSQSFVLSTEATSAIFGSCNDMFRTKPIEILISSLLHSFARIFNDRPLPTIWNEGHGREVWDDSLDLSRTCGWFTTMAPVVVSSSQQETLQDYVREVKDSMRSMSQNGWSQFVSHFVNNNDSDKFISNLPTEIMFNYSGSYGQLERQDSLFQNIAAPNSQLEHAAPVSNFRRHAIFDVLPVVNRGRISINFICPKMVASRFPISDWVAQYQTSLESLGQELIIQSNNDKMLTLSDFPGVFDSYEDIEEFHEDIFPTLDISSVDEIEHIYSTTPMQEGILISQIKDDKTYHSRLQVKVTSIESGFASRPIDLMRLQKAWQSVVQRHDLLRAVFVHDFPGNSVTAQVILLNQRPSIQVLYNSNKSAVTQSLVSRDPPHYTASSLQHHLTIHVLSDYEARLILEINHAIVDGHSTKVLAQDLQRAYRGDATSAAPSYADFVSFVNKQSRDKGVQYWAEILEGAEPCHFPDLSASSPQEDEQNGRTICVPDLDTGRIREFCKDQEITSATVIHLAWAVVLRWYTGSSDTSFGILCSGRDLPIDGIDDMFGPLIGMLTCRVNFDETSVAEVLHRLHNHYLESLPHQTVSLAEVHDALDLGTNPLFNSIISFQNDNSRERETSQHEQQEGSHDVDISLAEGHDPAEYPIGVRVIDSRDRLIVTIDTQWALDDIEAARIGHRFSTAVDSIISNSQSPIESLKALSPDAQDQFWKWNSVVPEASNICVHELVETSALIHSDRLAICSWDGELTYRELMEHAGRLASWLIHRGLSPETIVPVCFEKSRWTVVAILGILKAGCAFVLLDPLQPETRLRKIVQQTNASIGLSSQSSSQLLSKMVADVVIVTELSSYVDSPVLPNAQSRGSPTSLMYVIFTSGTTGEPKGTMINHKSFASAITHQAHRISFSPKTRILDFASYTFDVSIHTLMMTLATGGCVCVPSEEERSDSLVETIGRFSVNTIDVTPSVCRLLNPEEIPSVHTMIVGGEQLKATDISHWPARVRVINCYGPSECTPTSTINDTQGPTTITAIGQGVGAVTWVVDPMNPNYLAPEGTVGELLIEGPIVGQGYLNDPSRTAESFIHDPEFLLKGSSWCKGRHGRLYKTGDLVRYQSDGTLAFEGRKDAQIKLRGQRIELEEIEHHLMELTRVKDVTVEVICPSEAEGQQTLAAFIVLNGGNVNDTHDSVLYHSVVVSSFSNYAALEESLSKLLPSYMIPTIWFVVDAMPLTSSGKVDRRKLREVGSSSFVAQLSQKSTKDKRRPTNSIEISLQSLWGQVLGIENSHIGLDDNFFRLGGDSLRAMRMVSSAKKAGLRLSVAQIFQHPKLEDLASGLRTDLNSQHVPTAQDELKPFSLLSMGGQDLGEFVDQVAQLCSTDRVAIEDIYPATPLQQGLMALSIKRPGEYVLQNVMEIHPSTDRARLQRSWEEAVRRTPILRTSIVQHHAIDGLLQVVTKASILKWRHGDDVNVYLELDKAEPMHLGEQLTRLAVISDGNTGKSFLAWTIHHALYDGQSLPAVQSMVHNIYHNELGRIPNSLPWSNFVNYLLGQDTQASTTFWDQYLKDYQSTSFPPWPSNLIDEVKADTFVSSSFELPPVTESSVTLATIIRAAWALTIHHNTGSSDVVFGATVLGRAAPVPGIEDIIGPTVATVPVRVNVPQKDTQSTVSQFLLQVQAQSTAMIPHEQFGLHGISKISQDAQRACDFKTLLVIQPDEDNDDGQKPHGEPGVWREALATSGELSTYPLTVTCRVSVTGSLHLGCYLDPHVLPQWRAERISEQLGFFIQELSKLDPRQKLHQIDSLTTSDKELLCAWNKKVPDPVDQHAHELISHRVKSQPEASAICAWDGDMNYKELDVASSNLAAHLVDAYGLTAGAMVPLYFDKSIWYIVAILAVMKAGAAFVPLNTTQTPENREIILRQLDTSIALASWHLAGDLQSSGPERVVSVGPELLASFCGEEGDKDDTSEPRDPNSPAYVIFTSGSTGEPKGVVVENRALATSCWHHGLAIGLKTTSRVLQFASYAFDASISEIITTLVHGGTICILSAQDVQNNLEGGIHTMGINTAYLTPSVMKLINPAAVPELKTVMLAGESSTIKDFKRWSRPKQRVLHGYGPTECAILCFLATVDLDTPGEINPACIGTAVGGISWIVDPDDHERLLPIGAIGELLIEGHILARGYLNDQDKTEAAFISAPGWLSRADSSRCGRLYKTGDLVSYNVDGSLTFHSRKDTQTKIRGQRVELAGVEAALLQCLDNAIQVVSEVINPVGHGANPMLAAFVVMSSDDSEIFTPIHNEGGLGILSVTSSFETRMSELVPSYMVPSVCFIIRELPLKLSGKADRQKLRDIGSSFSVTKLAALRRIEGSKKRKPVTEAEQVLCDIVAKVLNLDVANIGLDDDFYRLGGDSITSMQLSSAARVQGLNISTANVTKHRTLGRILKTGTFNSHDGLSPTSSAHSQAIHDSSDNRVTLTPIQQMFFLQQTNPRCCYDQSFYLRPKTPIMRPQLESSLHRIVQAHPILRARFKQDSAGNWAQLISNSTEGSVRCIAQTCSNYQEVASAIRQQRGSLDLTDGPLVAAVLFEVGRDQTLFIVIHHLVVDLVSWRIILGDLESLLASGGVSEVSLESTTSLQTWSSLKAQHARDLTKAPRKQRTIPPPQTSYWSNQAFNTKRSDSTTILSFSIDRKVTSAILGACNDTFGTRPIELMISGLLFSFGQTFKDRTLPTVMNEGHGRETWDGSLGLDLSRTVGWFTTLYPVHVEPGTFCTPIVTARTSDTEQQRHGLLDFIARTHDAMTTEFSADNGAAWFTSQFATPQSAKSFVQSQLPVEIVFNYNGVYQQLERDDSFFEVCSLEEMANRDTSTSFGLGVEDNKYMKNNDLFNIDPLSAAEACMPSLFEVIAGVWDGRLCISMLYSRHLLHQEMIKEWFSTFETTLHRVSKELNAEL